MRASRAVVLCVAILLAVAAFGAGPAWSKRNTLGVYLSVAGSEPIGLSPDRPYTREGLSLSSDLRFATAAGAVECATDGPVGVANGGEYESPQTAALLAETTSESCSSTMSDVTSPAIDGFGGVPIIWWAVLRGSGGVTLCTDASVYFVGGCRRMGDSAIDVMSGSTSCTYLYHHGKEVAGMPGSFVPAAFGSAESQPVEITLPAQQLELTTSEEKSPAYSACPPTGELSASFMLESEHDGPVLAQVVEPHQELLVTPRNKHGRSTPGTAKASPCAALAEGAHTCVIHLTNGDKQESMEVREVVLGEENSWDFVRVPIEGECVASTEAGQATVLPPGHTCSVAIEATSLLFEEYFPSGELYVVTSAQPGGRRIGESIPL